MAKCGTASHRRSWRRAGRAGPARSSSNELHRHQAVPTEDR